MNTQETNAEEKPPIWNPNLAAILSIPLTQFLEHIYTCSTGERWVSRSEPQHLRNG